jgi:hypothetical protein
MFFSKERSSPSKSNSSKYAPLAPHDDGEDSNINLEKRSSEADDDLPLLAASDNLPTSPKPSQCPKLILYFSFALALLSAVNFALLPATLSKYHAYPFSDSELEALPFGDARLGLDRAAKMMPLPETYRQAWPDKIARVSRKLKRAVWGQGVQVYITVEVRILQYLFHSFCLLLRVQLLTRDKDSTVMRFPVPSNGTNICALSWTPPPETSARAKDLTTKGEITQIEAWQLIAVSANGSPNMDELNYDTLSYSTLPVRGELLGVLDITAKPNSTTVGFACPSKAENLVVEMRCQRVACHVSFIQAEMLKPRFGFTLVRKQE